MSMWVFGLCCAGIALILAWFIPTLWQGMGGAFPLFLFAGFWWARPMSWESEFEDALKRLGKAR